MIPPEQETTIAPNIPVITNRPENGSVHAEPEGSATNKVKPSLDNNNGIHEQHQQHQHQHQPQPTTAAERFSILHQSLRPITLKVLINLLSLSHHYIYIYILCLVLIILRKIYFIFFESSLTQLLIISLSPELKINILYLD